MRASEMNPVKENRAFVKGNGACVNVDQTAFATRRARIQAEKAKDRKIENLEAKVDQLTTLVEQLVKGN